MAFVAFQDVGKIYKSGEVKVQALRDATFQVEKGELCVIVGPSGAGKTTLLNILGGMDTLTSGKVFLDGAEVPPHRPAHHSISETGLGLGFTRLSTTVPFFTCTTRSAMAVRAEL